MSKSKSIKEMNDKELIEEYNGYYEQIHLIGSHSTKDLRMLDTIEIELIRRGYTKYTKVEWVK